MKRILSILAFLLLLADGAQAAQFRLNGVFSFSDDTDHETQCMYGFGPEVLFDRKENESLSILAGRRHFKNDTVDFPSIGDSETFTFLTASGGRRLGEKFRLDGRLSLYDSGHWSPVLYAGSVGFDPSARWHLEASAERDLVESLEAINRRLYVDSYNAAVDFEIAPGWTAVGAYTHQYIDDGNDRDIELLKIYYMPRGLDWLRLEAYGKHLTSSFEGVGYFSPERLWEYMAIAQVSRPLAGDRFLWRARGGAGQQFVNNEPGKISALIELKVRGWFSDSLGAEAVGGFSNQSSVIAAGTDYSRYYATLMLIYAF
jgi:hypothetical protein